MSDRPPIPKPPEWQQFRDKHSGECGWCYLLSNGWWHCHYTNGQDVNKSKPNIEIIEEDK